MYSNASQLPDSFKELRSKFSYKAAAPTPKESKAEKPKEKRRKISLVEGDTALGIHHKIQTKRYTGYWSLNKALLAFGGAVGCIAISQWLPAMAICLYAGYTFQEWETDHSKYKSWSKRPVLHADMKLMNKHETDRIPLEGLYDFFSAKLPPSMMD